MQSRPNLSFSKDVLAQKGNTPLHLAVLQNNVEMVEAILKSDMKYHAENALGQTAFELACELGYYDCAEKFESLLSDYVDTTDGKYGRLFLAAIDHKKLDLARRLHQAGASTAARTRVMGYYALHAAVKNHCTDAVEFLLSIKASMIDFDGRRMTPIALACEERSWKCAEKLIATIEPSRMTSKELADLQLEQCLDAAIRLNSMELIKLLLKHGAPINDYDDYFGNCALWVAIKHAYDKPEILLLLLEHGADPNMRNKLGENMCDVAIGMKKFLMADILSAYDSGLSPEIVKEFVTKTDECFQKLYSPGNHHLKTLAILNEYFFMIHTLFALDIKALSAKRNLLNLNKDKHEDDIDILDRQITSLQHFQNYPDVSVKLDDSFDHTTVGYHIADHLKRLEQIQQYHVRIKEYLVGLSGRIDAQHWHVKSFLEVFSNKWHNGIPAHIQLMKNELSTLKAESSIADTLKIYSDVAKILQEIKPDRCRHVDTAAFYQQEKMNIDSMHFMPKVDVVKVVANNFQVR